MCSKRSTLRSNSFREYLVEEPIGCGTANGHVSEIREGFIGEIDGKSSAPHAFVDHSGGCGFAARSDGDCPVAVRVTIGLGAHESERKGHHVLRISIIGETTSSQSCRVISDVTFALAAR